MLDRGTGLRIQRMRVALAITLEIIAVVTRGGNAIAIELDDALRHTLIIPRRFDGDPPRRVTRLSASCLELASDFHQIAFDPERFQPLRHQIDSVTRSDAVEIDLDGRILAQLLADNLQMPVTDSLAGLGNFLGRRYLLTAPLRAEPPEVEQRLNGQVQCAVAFLRQLLPSQHELAGGLGHGHALPCREGIEGFDI